VLAELTNQNDRSGNLLDETIAFIRIRPRADSAFS
jgi:hypothetical protein